MQARVGDRIIIRGKTVGSPDRHGRIIEVNGAVDTAGYLVEFDDGRQSVIYPGTDFVVERGESTAQR